MISLKKLFKRISKYVVYGLLFSILFSCGYVKDQAKSNIVSSNIIKKCSFNVENFKYIVKKNINKDIDCIKKNLETFNKVVTSQEKEIIQKRSIKNFITSFFNISTDSISNTLDLMFDLIQIMYNSKENISNVNNIKLFFETLKKFNIVFTKIFEINDSLNKKNISLEQASILIHKSIKPFAQHLLSEMQNNQNNKHNRYNNINFDKLVKNILNSGNTKLSSDYKRTIFVLKQLLVGGKKNILTPVQLKEFISKFDTFFVLIFKISHLKHSSLTIFEKTSMSSQILQDFFNLAKHNKKYFVNSNLFINMQDFKLITSIILKNKNLTNLIVNNSKNLKLYLLNNNKNISAIDGFSYQEIKKIITLTRLFLTFKYSFDSINNLSKQFYQKDIITKRIKKISNNTKKQIIKIVNNNNFAFNQNLFLIDYISDLYTNHNFLHFFPNIQTLFNTKKSYTLNLKALFILKKMLIGGNSTLTSNDILKSSKKLPALYNILYQSMRQKLIKNKEKKITSYISILQTIRLNLKLENKLHDIKTSDLLTIVKVIFPDEPIFKYRKVVINLKQHILGGKDNVYSPQDINQLFLIVIDLLQNTLYTSIHYNLNKNLLEHNNVINTKDILFEKILPIRLTDKQLSKYKANFIQIEKKFRYFRSLKYKASYWNHKISRNYDSFLEVNLIKYLYDILIRFYGSNQSLSVYQINLILKLFKPVLLEHHLWTSYIKTFARNMLLLSDLFQNISNGNNVLDSFEATEYSIVALSAMSMTTNFIDNIKKQHPQCLISQLNHKDNKEKEKKKDLINVTCFNHLFFQTFLDNIDYKHQLPKLNSFIKSLSKEEQINYLVLISSFARGKINVNNPLNQHDIVLIIGAMLNIESTMIRFDLNQNNTLELEELESAFHIYKKSIQMLSSYDPEKIYYYLVEKGEIPDWRIIFYSKPDQIIASRKNIATLLNFIVNYHKR